MWFAGNCSVLEYLDEWRQLSCSRAEDSAGGLGPRLQGQLVRWLSSFLPSFM